MHQNIRSLSVFCFALIMTLAQEAAAQTFSVLHNFTDGADGANPRATLTVGPSGVLYGTAEGGGPHGYGTVFRLNQVNSAWVFSSLFGFTAWDCQSERHEH